MDNVQILLQTVVPLHLLNQMQMLQPEKWAHIAAVREGTAFRLYVDGKLEASPRTASTTMPNDSSVTLIDIGRRRYASLEQIPYEGFISNVRIIKGTALYTSNFTPPTDPLTNVTNTKLLCCQSNTSATAVAAAPNLSAINDGTHWSGATVTGSNATFSNLFDGDNTTSAQQATLGCYRYLLQILVL